MGGAKERNAQQPLEKECAHLTAKQERRSRDTLQEDAKGKATGHQEGEERRE